VLVGLGFSLRSILFVAAGLSSCFWLDAAALLCVPVGQILPNCSTSAVQELISSFALGAVASAWS
jgi:hypothetical protein